MKFIEVKDVDFAYEEESNEILKNFSIDIEKGSFVAILGHNGSGKSTIAKHMNALVVPTEGTVLVDGLDTKDLEKVWDIRAKAGMFFQNPDNQLVATIV